MSDYILHLEDFTIVRTGNSIDIVAESKPDIYFWQHTALLTLVLFPGQNEEPYHFYQFTVQINDEPAQTLWIAHVTGIPTDVSYDAWLIAEGNEPGQLQQIHDISIPDYVDPRNPGDPFNPAHTYVQALPHRRGNKNVPHRRLPIFTTLYE